ncbi:MAG: PGN_0703 family putative restriction endonuclease [Leucobacter sp.]|uniref:PGN_0703 family putative restriction endonuclease n=1 Tax=Flaviflexus sp. TaxID=1969482 RepID=UPI003F91FF2A
MNSSEPYGPQRLGAEPRTQQRLRFHQSWYRAEILGLPKWGSTPKGQPIGSILASQDARGMLNFVDESAANLADQRHAAGWGVNPDHVSRYMTSSQVLMFNMFGGFSRRLEWLTHTLQQLPEFLHLTEALAMHIEYGGQSIAHLTGDKTLVDVLIEYNSTEGPGVLAVEVKYMDRFSSRSYNLGENSHYKAIAERSGTWSGIERLVSGSDQQLFRVHAMAAIRCTTLGYDLTRAQVLTIAPAERIDTSLAVDQYKLGLNDQGSASHTCLVDWLHAMEATSSTPSEKATVSKLLQRYTDLIPSNEGWNQLLVEHERRRLSARRSSSNTLQD